ncbi:syntaxin-18-like isoform X2 [Paramacrobiotus metropolitanus]|uniref:syntaxin-18-like isoform X2 n=1 Tax=Paramacrobiotus metropolitanus TaxID=2943436 RepID=UPI002446042D|nr:syntaxin-18-like isoform X2 [Paramacrobiotus metropolitanus]
MDISATFRGLCKARKSLEQHLQNGSDMGSGNIHRKKAPDTAGVKRETSPFQKHAIEILNLLAQARDYILAHRKEYLDFEVGSESKRVDLETEALRQLECCSDHLVSLQKDVEHNRVQVKQHRSAVVTILKNYMTTVSKLLTDQQELRVNRALEHAKLSKLESMGTKRVPKNRPDRDGKRLRNDGNDSNGHAHHVMLEEDQLHSAPTKEIFSADELQMFENENASLYQELSGMQDEIKRIENQMNEISKLQNIFTENVLVQEQQIDDVAATAVSTTENIKAGNIDIREEWASGAVVV